MNIERMAKQVVLLLTLLTAVLVVISFTLQIVVSEDSPSYQQKITKLFNVDEEENIPNWYSTSLLLGAGSLFAVIGVCRQQRREPDVRQYFLMSALFAYLSCDEAVSIHEKFIKPLRALLHTNGLLYFAWVIPAVIILIGLALFFRPFILRMRRFTRNGFLVAAAVYLTGAVGMEAIGGAVFQQTGDVGLLYLVLTHVEESLEMAGVIIMIYVLLREALHYVPSAAQIETANVKSISALNVESAVK